MVVDADLVATHSSGGLRYALAGTDCDVAEYAAVEQQDPQTNPSIARVARQGRWPRSSVGRYRCIYRADPTLRYEGAHYVVRTDDGYLWGNASVHDFKPALDVTSELLFTHRTSQRDYERRDQALAYYKLRDAVGAEQLVGSAA